MSGRTTRRTFLQATGAGLLTTTFVAGCETGDASNGSAADTADLDAKEAPMLARMVEAGDLPPLEDRLPDSPLVVEPVEELGAYGGEMSSLVTGPGDWVWLYRTVGYDQLMSWNRDYTDSVPNVAESIEVLDGGRSYVLHLRPGMKWSDGEPFTADDLIFAHDDVFNHPDLYPGGPPTYLTAGGEPAILEKLDDATIRVDFAEPNGLFLYRLATNEALPFTTYPRHHLEQLHLNYNPDVDAMAKDEGFAGWVEMWENKATWWTNAEYPTLCAWRLTTALGEENQVVAERNPYYWKVDPEGRQLPYIDRVVYALIEDPEVATVRAAGGDVDLHFQVFTNIQNKPVLADSREEGNYRFVDLTESDMNQMVIALNLTHRDPAKREIFSNLDFRIGLSYAINREELINAVYQQQGEPWQAAPRPESEFFDEEMAKQYTEFDLELANQHLDQAGFTERDGDGFRLGPDGNRIAFDVDVPSDLNPQMVPAMELIREYWAEVGVDARLQPGGFTVIYERKEANEHDAVVWRGDGGWVDAVLDPRWYVPWWFESNYAIPWANWYQNPDGDTELTEEPPAETKRQMEIYDQVKATADPDERAELFTQVLTIAKEQFYVIGTVLAAGDYGIVDNNIHNVPDPIPAGWVYPHPAPSQLEQYYISEG